MFIVAPLYYRSGRIANFGWTTICKWVHPIATLPSDKGDSTPLCSQDDRQFCESSPLPRAQTNYAGSDPNHLAHQQPHLVNRAAGFRSRPSDHSPRSSDSGFQDVGHVARKLLAVDGGDHARSQRPVLRRATTFDLMGGLVATPSRSESGVSPAGPISSRAASAGASAALGDSDAAFIACKRACASVATECSNV
eukprot:2639420-Pleurochrysis_carterae.AAC.3